MPRILIVDDDPEVRETMASLLRRRQIPCDQAESIETTRFALRSQEYDVLLLDVGLPDGSGLSLLPEIKAMRNPPEVIILTGQGDPEGAELAIEGGGWDYLVKPSPIRQINLSINRAVKYKEQRDLVRPKSLDLGGIIGSSRAMRDCFAVISQAAASGSNVLITGETGVGKELTARTIHAKSSRAGNPFVVVDCAALTETLVESTLFGHRKGAFTDATSDRDGLVKQAHTGVLFLDELGELPMNMQKSLLRVLQERKYRPIGETREQESDFRLICATNQDLEALVAAGAFRRDLYFRIKTFTLRLPPLRERPEDIKPLAEHFLAQLCTQYAMPNKAFGSDFLTTLACYDWPGNVRELSNALERAFVASGDQKILYAMHLPKDIRIKVARKRVENKPAGANQPHDEPLSLQLQESCDDLPSLKSFKLDSERRYLESLLKKNKDIMRMIEISGLSRSHFYALLKPSVSMKVRQPPVEKLM